MKKKSSVRLPDAPLQHRAVLRTSMNYVHREFTSDVEVPFGVSLTVPNQTVTIREQLRRFSGGTISGLQGEFTDPDDDAPDFSKMDVIEILQWREIALERQSEILERFRQASVELAKKDDEARFEAEVQVRLAAREAAIVEAPAD